MPDIVSVADFSGQQVDIAVTSPGRAPAADSKPVVLSTEDKAALDAIPQALGAAEFFPETQPISAAALPLPAGAASDAKLDQLIAGLIGTEYETVAAGQADQVLGTAGAAGDLLAAVLIVPSSTSPGAVSIRDGAGPAITIFAGGADAIATLHPFSVPLGLRATGAGWRLSTGAGVAAVAVGNFA